MEQSNKLCCWQKLPTAGNTVPSRAAALSVHKAKRGRTRMTWVLGTNKQAGLQGVVTWAGWLNSEDNGDKNQRVYNRNNKRRDMSNCNKDESVWQLCLWSPLRAILRFCFVVIMFWIVSIHKQVLCKTTLFLTVCLKIRSPEKQHLIRRLIL